MPPATGTALILLVAFVLPGFVVVLLQERTFKRAEDPTPFDRLLRAIYYSLWCFLVLAVVSIALGLDRTYVESLYRRHEADPAHLVWRTALLILGPAGAVWLSTLIWQESGANEWVLEKLRMNARHQRPTGWDFWFRKGIQTHLRIIYPDGRSIWGYYGERSFASYAKDGLDLFLEHIYPERMIESNEASADAPGPWFGTPHTHSRGGWVKVQDAVCIELYDFPDAQTPGTTAPDATKGRPSGAGGATASAKPTSPTDVSSADAAPAEEG